MSGPVYAHWAARALESESAGHEPIALPDDDRARAIAAIERELVAQRARRARGTWVLRLSVAAALVVGVGAAAFAARRASVPAVAMTSPPSAASATAPLVPPSPASILTGSTPTPQAPAATAPRPVTIVAHLTGTGAAVQTSTATLRDGEAVRAGSRVVSRGASHAILAFSTGTELSVEDDGDMTVLGDGPSQVFALDAGAVRAHVAKLGAGERFVVRTPDAEVEVRGTSFRVSIAPTDPACGGGSVTRVAVDEGVVVVRQAGIEARVAKGETWPAGCDAAPPSRPVLTPSARAASTIPGPLARAARPSASSLAEQNDAFANALALKNTGRGADAADAFDQFVRKYPSSNLAEGASVERMDLLLSIDHARGIAAASQYLRRYPNGYAAADAKAAIAGER